MPRIIANSPAICGLGTVLLAGVADIPEVYLPRLESLGRERRAGIVYVGAFSMDNLAEKPQAHHIQREHLILAVAHVLEHVAVPLGALAGFDLLPALLYGESARNLGHDMLANWERVAVSSFQSVLQQSMIK